MAPSPPGSTASISAARPVTPARGRPAANDLPVSKTSGSTPLCSTANIRPVRPNPGLNLVDDQDDLLAPTDRGQPLEEGRGRRYEAALAEHRLDDDRGDVVGGDPRDEHALHGI